MRVGAAQTGSLESFGFVGVRTKGQDEIRLQNFAYIAWVSLLRLVSLGLSNNGRNRFVLKPTNQDSFCSPDGQETKKHDGSCRTNSYSVRSVIVRSVRVRFVIFEVTLTPADRGFLLGPVCNS